MKSYWDAICRSLEEEGKTPPPVELLKGSDENTVAWLAYLMQEWYLEGSPANPYKFVTDTVQFKLVEEVRHRSGSYRTKSNRNAGLTRLVCHARHACRCLIRPMGTGASCWQR